MVPAICSMAFAGCSDVAGTTGPHPTVNLQSAVVGLLPNGIYTIPEVSLVGETEESLKKLLARRVAEVESYAASARTNPPGHDNQQILGSDSCIGFVPAAFFLR
jgi:hypothetical protein